MASVTYTENPDECSFPKLIQSFGTLRNNHFLEIDSRHGSGWISYIPIEPGLQMRLWNCCFSDGLTILRNGIHSVERNFTLISYLDTGNFILNYLHNQPPVVNPVWDTLLVSSDADFEVSLLPGKYVRCISINFSAAWFRKNVLSDGYEHTQLMKRLSLDTDPFLVFESLSVAERKQGELFFEEDLIRAFGKFFWRSKVLNMLTFFFSKTVKRLSLPHASCNHQMEKMVEVEKQLVDNVNNGLPDLGTLARKLAISESTLKRYFRRIYGKNIYEYYLEKRMGVAWHLLTERNKTVSETASIIGYENTSHFITVFRKQFGILPGALRKEIFYKAS